MTPPGRRRPSPRTSCIRCWGSWRAAAPADRPGAPDPRRVRFLSMPAQPAPPPLAERPLAHLVLAVPPSGIRRFFDILATMDDVISLGVGEPDFDTPRQIVEAGVESLREGRTHYTSNFGTIELRRAPAGPPQRPYGLRYPPQEEVLVTLGGSA